MDVFRLREPSLGSLSRRKRRRDCSPLNDAKCGAPAVPGLRAFAVPFGFKTTSPQYPRCSSRCRISPTTMNPSCSDMVFGLNIKHKFYVGTVKKAHWVSARLAGIIDRIQRVLSPRDAKGRMLAGDSERSFAGCSSVRSSPTMALVLADGINLTETETTLSSATA